MAGTRVVVVSWVAHHGRSDGLARELGGEAVYMPWAAARRSLPRTVLGWLRSGARTVRVARSLAPGSLLVVMAPPVFAPLVARIARRRGVGLVIDVHSGALNDRRWAATFGLMRRLIRRADAALVTNTAVLAGHDVGDATVLVVHDPLREPPDVAPRPAPGRPYVVFPGTGAPDEPYGALEEAAGLLAGDVDVVATGNAAGRLEGDTVRATGFVPDAEYAELLRNAAAVLALTTREATMQRSAYEALELGVPIVASDTALLRDVLGPAAVLVANDGPAIAAGVRAALADRERLQREGRDLARRLVAANRAAIERLRGLAGGRAASVS